MDRAKVEQLNTAVRKMSRLNRVLQMKCYQCSGDLRLVRIIAHHEEEGITPSILAEKLEIALPTVSRKLSVLEKQELIFRKRQGPGQPNRIYVKLPKETIHYTDRFLSLRQTENCPIGRQDSFPDTDRKLSGNKKEIKKNNLEKRGSKDPLSPYGKFQNVFLSEKELEEVRQSVSDWQEYIERLSGYMASTGKSYKNHLATIRNWAKRDKPQGRQAASKSNNPFLDMVGDGYE